MKKLSLFVLLNAFVIPLIAQQRDWNSLMHFPSKKEIENYNKTSKAHSPYLCAWFESGFVGKFKQISVDFKADYLPKGTYCSLANFYIDYSDQLKQYSKVFQDGHISGYAGFQRNHIDPSHYNGILSFWDVYCWNNNENKTTIRAERIWPEGKVADESFSHEGSGAHYLPDYPWKAKNWYRMLLQCGKSSLTGNTTVEYWVCDLSTKAWTKLCVYDLGVPDLSFTGNIAAFLENFQVESSGEIRTLEIRNVRVLSANTNEWVAIESANIAPQYDYLGSYQYGADDNTIWMISTGVPNCAPQTGNVKVKIKNLESGRPF